jgi:Protein of unknown function (DUF3043)
VRLLRRRSEAPAEVDPAQPVTAADAAAPGRPTGKGRPTPRRREAQRRRTGPVAPPPKNRREANRRAREQGADRRAEARAGLRAGDDRYLPPRDRGPERKLVRDIVDSRRNAGVLFLLSAVVYFVGLIIPSVQVKAAISALWLTVVILLVVDSTLIGLRIRKLMRERFPDSTEKLPSLIFYGATRAVMIRRWRMPKPAVEVGDPI